MKTIAVYTSRTIATCLILIFIHSCNKNEGTPKPIIESIEPTSAKYNVSLTINGSNFNKSASGNVVKINGVDAEVAQASSKQLVVIVPKGSGSGLVTVQTAGGQADGPTFNYLYTATVSTFAGSGSLNNQDGTGSAASFNYPAGLVFDDQDNLFVTDRYNHSIRKITPSGVVTTVAGSSGGTVDGNGTSAQLYFPYGITRDAAGNFYISTNGSVRKMTPSYDITTIAGSTNTGYADGTGADAQFNAISGIAVGPDGTLYAADNSRIRKITSAGVVTSIAGDGSIAFVPSGVIIDANSNLFITDLASYQVKKMTPDGIITIIAGTSSSGYVDGEAAQAKFIFPRGMVIDKNSDIIVADNLYIRRISSGLVSTIAGNGTFGLVNGDGIIAEFSIATCVAMNSKGELYVGESNNSVIRKIILE